MKKYLILILTFLCLGCLDQPASARRYEHHHSGSSRKWEASRILEKTRYYVLRADRMARGPERYRLKSAYANQRYARTYYSRGLYERTIRYSLRARDIAQDIIAKHRHHGPPPPPPPRGRSRGSISVRLRL
jgi:hypothetical protein